MKTKALLLLISLYTQSLHPQDSAVVFDLVYQGDFPVSLWGKQTKPAHLVKDQPDYLVVRDSSSFQIFRFDSTTWIESGHIPFPQNHTLWDLPYSWTIGDLDNDGADEIITWNGHKIVRFILQSGSFTRKDYDFPLTVEQGVIGDIDNEGQNELVVFAFADSLYRFVDGYKGGTVLDLCVTRLDSGRLNLIFADGGMSGYMDSKVVPPDLLHFIAPFTVTDQNQLVITTSQSDMSASFYHVWSWDYSMPRKAEQFHLINGKKVKEIPYAEKPARRGDPVIHTSPPIEEYPFSYGVISPIIIGGKSAFLDAEYDPPLGGRPYVLRLEQDHFNLQRIIFRDSDQYAGGSLWMDPDGKGNGLLGLTYLPYKSGDRPEQMNWHYSFYRMP